MNVIHAGLDILKSEVKTDHTVLPGVNNALEMLEDIYSASESAVSILNDLLQYEHLNAGEVNNHSPIL